jgi:hypothetical protein
VRSIACPKPGSTIFSEGATIMLAEIFMVRLEMLLRTIASSSPMPVTDTRFVPVTLPRESGRRTP